MTELLIAPILLIASVQSAPAQVKISQVNPPISGITSSLANTVNKTNQVVGNYTTGTGANVVTRGFEYLGGTKYKTIVFPKAANFTRANGINDAGEIVGDFFGADNFYHGYTLISGKFSQYDVNKGVVSTSIFSVNNAGDFAGAAGSNGPNQGFVNIGGTVTEFYASGTDNTFVLGINNLDQAVGQYYDSSNNSHGFYRDATGVITEIGFPGALQTACTGINDSGEIVGWYEDASQQFHGFTDINGTFAGSDLIFIGGVNNAGTYVGYYIGPGASGYQNFGYLASPVTFNISTITVSKAQSTSVYGVNNGAAMVGTYTNSVGAQHGMMLLATGKVTNIDDPNALAGQTYPQGINTTGQVVGYYVNSANNAQAFSYFSGAYTDIGPAGAQYSYAETVNDMGQILGIFGDSSGEHAFLDTNGAYSIIDVPNALATAAWGISNNSLMTLQWLDANNIWESSLYDGTTFTTIDVPGAAQTFAHSINKSGNIVFSWFDFYGNYHSALRSGGSYYLFDDPKGTSTRADGLNDSNLIVGRFNPTGSLNFDGFKATLK